MAVEPTGFQLLVDAIHGSWRKWVLPCTAVGLSSSTAVTKTASDRRSILTTGFFHSPPNLRLYPGRLPRITPTISPNPRLHSAVASRASNIQASSSVSPTTATIMATNTTPVQASPTMCKNAVLTHKTNLARVEPHPHGEIAALRSILGLPCRCLSHFRKAS